MERSVPDFGSRKSDERKFLRRIATCDCVYSFSMVPETEDGSGWPQELRSKLRPTAMMRNRFSTRAQANRQSTLPQESENCCEISAATSPESSFLVLFSNATSVCRD